MARPPWRGAGRAGGPRRARVDDRGPAPALTDAGPSSVADSRIRSVVRLLTNGLLPGCCGCRRCRLCGGWSEFSLQVKGVEVDHVDQSVGVAPVGFACEEGEQLGADRRTGGAEELLAELEQLDEV